MKTRIYAAAAVKGLRVKLCQLLFWACILVQVTIHRRLLIGRDGHLDQSEAYNISYCPGLAPPGE